MNIKFGKWISTNNLYFVTLKQLIDIEIDNKTKEKNYIMPKICKYTICSKKMNSYIDVFNNHKYETITNTKKGEYGVRNITPLTYDKSFISLTELSNKLQELEEQSDKLCKLNKIKPNSIKTKKLIPFPKKY